MYENGPLLFYKANCMTSQPTVYQIINKQIKKKKKKHGFVFLPHWKVLTVRI